MKRYFIPLILLFASLTWAADSTYGPKIYKMDGGDRQVVASGGSLDVESGGEIDIESGGSLKIAGTNKATQLGRLPAADGTNGQYLQTNGAGVWSFAAGTSGSLDDAYNIGIAITADAGAVAVTNNAADNNGVLAITKNPTGAQSGDAVTITVGAQATGDALQFANTGSGNDIAGSGGTWSISKAGVGTFSSFGSLTAGLTVTGGTVSLNASSNNATNLNTGTSAGALSLGGGSGTVAVNSTSWDVSTAGAVSGVTTLGMSGDLTNSGGDVILSNGKALKGSTTTAQTVKVQGYDVDNTTYRDAITITNGDTVGVAVGSNNETVAVNSSDWDISATGDMTGIGAITMDGVLTINNAAPVLYPNEAITITHASNGAADDLTIDQTGGNDASLLLKSAGTGTDAIGIAASAGGITMSSTAVASAWTQTSTGAADDLTISVAGNTDSSLILTSAGSGTDALTLSTTANAGDIVVSSNDKIDMDSVGTFALNVAGDTLLIQVDSDGAADDLTIKVDGDDDSSIILDSDGTGADAIKIGATNAAGGIDVDAGTNGINILSTGGSVAIGSTYNGASAIALTANGGTNETIVVTNTQGTGAGAITLTATAGGIALNASSGITTGDAVTGDGTAAFGGFLKTVTNDDNGKTLSVTESGTVQTNAAASGAAAWVLPTAAAGLEYTFVVMAAQELRVTPAAGDVINIAGTAGDAAEYWSADAVGETLHLIAVDATNWVAISSTGTWTQQTP